MNAAVGQIQDTPFVLEQRESGIVRLTLNRGSRFNPLSLDMINALDAALVRIGQEADARVIVIAADGKGFCAGHDLKELRAHSADPAWQKTLFDACNRLMLRMTQVPQPIIARVHGIATAAGCQLVSMCDLAFAADEASFALPGVNIGVFCSTPAVGVARNIGRKRAMEMLLTGEMFSAAQAEDWGLINRCVPADQLDVLVAQFATRIASRSRSVIGLGKKTFYSQIDQGLRTAYEMAGDTMVCNVGLPDASEGIDAFLQKRPPRWPAA
ncbi:MAG: enoyl-CoA hydratase [Steroidobacteraceae bacterium]